MSLRHISLALPGSFITGAETIISLGKEFFSNDHKIHYAGTGVSMMDASIFADKSLVDDAPKGSVYIEDVWLSYFVYHKPEWRIMYMETPGVVIGGADSVALFKVVQKKINRQSRISKNTYRYGLVFTSRNTLVN